MEKRKTSWEWRDRAFATKADLIKHLSDRARSAVENVLGPPVTEIQGSSRQVHHIHFKVPILLGPKPSKQKPGKVPSVTAPAQPKGKKAKKPSKPAVDQTVEEYFGKV